MEKIHQFIDKFKSCYQVDPVVVSQAPGRLELLGNHTDYNQGLVLSCAVNLNTRFALCPVKGYVCRIVDFRSGEQMIIDLKKLNAPPVINGAGYVKGVLVELIRRGHQISAFDAAIESDVPLSAGMSSSAALEISAALAIGAAFGIELEPAEWARVGRSVENTYFGLGSGLLDQLSSVYGEEGKILLCDFREEAVTKSFSLPQGCSIAVINSMQKHRLVSSQYNERRADCEHAVKTLKPLLPNILSLRDVSLDELQAARSYLNWREYRRALHVVGECTRVQAGIRHLSENDAEGFGRLWFDSHESSRMNFENSTPKLDALVELAHTIPGGLGARLSGGGFGGITVHLVKSDAAEDYVKQIGAAYHLQGNPQPQSFILTPGDGAQVWML